MLSHDPIIRPARPDEAEAFARLHVTVGRATYRDEATPEALEQLDEARRLPYWVKATTRQTADQGVWVAVADGDVVGVISLGPSDNEAFGGRLEIKHLYVAGQAQGQNIGKRLLLTALAHVAPRGVGLAVVKQNDQARRFYAAMGGVEHGAFIDPGPLWRSENILVVWD